MLSLQEIRRFLVNNLMFYLEESKKEYSCLEYSHFFSHSCKDVEMILYDQGLLAFSLEKLSREDKRSIGYEWSCQSYHYQNCTVFHLKKVNLREIEILIDKISIFVMLSQEEAPWQSLAIDTSTGLSWLKPL